jgi:hypothetical protein
LRPATMPGWQPPRCATASALPAGALDRRWPPLIPKPVILIDESNTWAGAGLRWRLGPQPAGGDRRRDQLRHPGPSAPRSPPAAVRCRGNKQTDRRCTHVGVVDTGAGQPRRHHRHRHRRCGRHCAHQLDREGSAPGTQGARSPRVFTSHNGFRQTHRGCESCRTSRPQRRRPRRRPPRPSSNPDRTSVHRPVGGHPRARAWGRGPRKVRERPYPRAVSIPTPCRAGTPIHSAGVTGEMDPASTPTDRHRPALETAGRLARSSSGCGHAGRTRPSSAAAASTRPSRPATLAAAFEPPHQVTSRLGRTAPAVRKPPGVIRSQAVHHRRR